MTTQPEASPHRALSCLDGMLTRLQKLTRFLVASAGGTMFTESATERQPARTLPAMSKSPFHERYARLSRRLGGGASLWRGKDHLVSVRGRGFILPYSEDYRRFHLSEIQGFTLVKRSRLGMALLYGGGVLLFTLAVLACIAVGGQGWNAFLASVTFFFALGTLSCLALFVRHLVLGPLCRCEIVTETTQEPLFALNRYHAAREIVEALETEIRAVQAGLATGGVAAGGSDAALEGPERGSSRSPYVVPGTLPWTFGASVVFGFSCLAALHLESLALVVAVFFLLFGFACLILASLVFSVRKPSPDSLRHCLWSILGALFLFVGVATLYLLVAIADDNNYSMGIEGPFEAFTAIPGGGAFYFLFLGTSLAFLGLGGTGLFLSSTWRRRIEATRRGLAPSEPATEGEPTTPASAGVPPAPPTDDPPAPPAP